MLFLDPWLHHDFNLLFPRMRTARKREREESLNSEKLQIAFCCVVLYCRVRGSHDAEFRSPEGGIDEERFSEKKEDKIVILTHLL